MTLLPPPIAGEGWGGGKDKVRPPTPTLPRNGGREQAKQSTRFGVTPSREPAAQARVLRCGLDDACSLPTLHSREASRRASVVTSMRSRRRLKQLLIDTLRGTVVALSLLGYLAVSIGFP